MTHFSDRPQVKALSLAFAFSLTLAFAARSARADVVSYELRWRPPTTGEVTSYRAYVGTASKTYGAPIDLGLVTPGADGVAAKKVSGFDATKTNFVAMSAVGPGGESVLSNEITIAATQCAMSCDDHNPCTVDSCQVGVCKSTPAADGTSCGDSNTCNGIETCQVGTCVISPALTCNGPEKVAYKLRWRPADDRATSYRVYVGSMHAVYGAPITLGGITPGADGIATAAVSGFDTSKDAYVVMRAVGPGGESPLSNELVIRATRCADAGACDDGNVCTDYVCREGVCGTVPAAAGLTCDDHNAGTVADSCNLGVCSGRVPECTADPDCSDANVCTGVERCVDFRCQKGTALACAAPGTCQTGGCDAVLGCILEPVRDGTSCSDGNLCNGAETCSDGRCSAGAPLACEDPGVCQVATCDAAKGCAVSTLADGTSCNDSDDSTGGDVCNKGVCAGQPICPTKGALRTVRLGWSAAPDTSVTVLWDGPVRELGHLRVRKLGGDWRTFEVAPRETVSCEAHYALQVGDLKALRTYEYQVEFEGESGVTWSDLRQFSTAPAVGAFTGVHTTAFFASMGLDGAPASPEAARVVSAMQEFSPQVVLGGGGYAYSAEAVGIASNANDAIERFLAQISPLAATAPFLPVFGETEVHRANHGESDQYYRLRQPLPTKNPYYAFEYGQTFFAALNVPIPALIDPATTDGGAQLAWLETKLASARSRGLRFLVVYMHSDVYSTHPGATMNDETRNAFTDLMDKYQVNLVLTGDTPGFERSHPLKAGVPNVRPDEFVKKKFGTVYLRAGSAGREDYKSWAPDGAPSWLNIREGSMKSFVLLHQVDGTQLIVETIGLPEGGLDPITLDMFVLL